ncbi:MAG: YebC/PmpR family DNA-binding transcriptional regulator [Candidatus Magasanikbacteria bacterium]
MSGHSKWSKIQHKKGKADKARSNLFTKLSRAVTVAAQQGGSDPEMNFSLRLAIDKAKEGNVPKENIERAIKKGTGELDGGATIQEIIYEGYGPHGVAVLVETLTDNTNRTVSEIKHVFNTYGGSLGTPGSVQWQFQNLGVIRIASTKIQNSDLELEFIDAGVDDIVESEEGVEIICSKENLRGIMEILKEKNIVPDDSGLEWVTKEMIELDEQKSQSLEKLEDALDDLDDVGAVYTNEA